MSATESGIQPDRVEFVRESTPGTTPSDPSWVLFSDNIRSHEPTLEPNIEGQEGIGTPDYSGAFAGNQESTWTIEYDLQQWLLDGSGNAQDAAYDAVARNSNNRLPNTHTVVSRMDIDNLSAGQTINGSTSKDTRLYTVGKGGKADATFTANIDSGQPVLVALEYTFEKIQRYQIDQPPSDGSGKQIAVKTSTDDSSDQGTTVTIEGVDDSDSAASEDVTLDGSDATTLVDTDTAFQEIDAIEIGSELVYDLEVYEDDDSTNDSTAEGDQLAVIYGQNSYDHGEGDLGVPALGTGSHASALGSAYELPLDGDAYEWPSGTAVAGQVLTFEMSFSNNIETTPTDNGARPDVFEGGRDVEVSAGLRDEVESYAKSVDAMRTVQQNAKWTFSSPTGDSGSIEADNMTVTEVGQPREARESVIEVDVTLANQDGVTVS